MIWLCKSWIILLNAPFETWETFQLFMLGSIAEQCIRSDQVEFSDRCDSIGCGIFIRKVFLWNACHYLCHYNYISLLITNNSWVVLAVKSTVFLSNKCSSKIYNFGIFWNLSAFHYKIYQNFPWKCFKIQIFPIQWTWNAISCITMLPK